VNPLDVGRQSRSSQYRALWAEVQTTIPKVKRLDEIIKKDLIN
jgi:ubiquinone biosynthesis protein COQ9